MYLSKSTLARVRLNSDSLPRCNCLNWEILLESFVKGSYFCLRFLATFSMKRAPESSFSYNLLNSVCLDFVLRWSSSTIDVTWKPWLLAIILLSIWLDFRYWGDGTLFGCNSIFRLLFSIKMSKPGTSGYTLTFWKTLSTVVRKSLNYDLLLSTVWFILSSLDRNTFWSLQ